MKTPISELPAFDEETQRLNVIIETPRGSRNKYKFDPESGLFRFRKVLPLGAVYPFDFGFVPSTRGGDGDPLDVLVWPYSRETANTCSIAAGGATAESFSQYFSKRGSSA